MNRVPATTRPPRKPTHPRSNPGSGTTRRWNFDLRPFQWRIIRPPSRFIEQPPEEVGGAPAFNPAEEVDTAPALTGQKRGALGTAIDSETGRPLAGAHRGQAVRGLEIDTAPALGKQKRGQLPTKSELDISRIFTGQKRGALGTATEHDLGMEFTQPAGGAPLPTATEHDTAPALAGFKRAQAVRGLEHDDGLAFGKQKRGVLGTALEVDQAGVLEQAGLLVAPGSAEDESVVGAPTVQIIDPFLVAVGSNTDAQNNEGIAGVQVARVRKPSRVPGPEGALGVVAPMRGSHPSGWSR